MFPLIEITDSESVSTYNVMVGIALIAAILTFYSLCKKQSVPRAETENMAAVIALTLLSAALWSVLLNNFEHHQWDFSSPSGFVSGFTFYGGLLGGLLAAVPGCYLIGRKGRLTFTLLDILSVCLMLGHAIGRIGCFLGGCCYGKPTDGVLGLPYPIGGSWVRAYPTQLYDSAFLFLLFLYSRKNVSNALQRYLLFYGLFRFFIEFLRGDDRGLSWGLSPSQWISVLLIIAGTPLTLIRERKIPCRNKGRRFQK